ncbi:MAG: hypothetical protein U1D55_05215 [Phycisphaerae bacterium]
MLRRIIRHCAIASLLSGTITIAAGRVAKNSDQVQEQNPFHQPPAGESLRDRRLKFREQFEGMHRDQGRTLSPGLRTVTPPDPLPDLPAELSPKFAGRNPPGATPNLNQYGPFALPPFKLDNVQGEWVNLETQLIKPILVTSDDQHVVVANEPDDRLVVLSADLSSVVAEIVLGQGIAALAERPLPVAIPDQPHEIWVSVRHQSAVMVIDENTWRVTHVLRPPISTNGVGMREADTPGGIAFSADGRKAYVAGSTTDTLAVYDARGKTWMQNIPLRFAHNQMNPAMNEPYAVVASGNRVFVVSQISGNQSAALFAPAGPVDLIVKVTNFQGFSLPDFDVLEIDATTDTVVGVTKDVGTTLLGAAISPAGSLVISNMDAFNAQFLGETSFAAGKVVENRLTFIDLVGGAPLRFVTTEPPVIANPVAMPTDIAIDAAGRVFVAGYGSSNIGVFNSAGAALGTIATDAGPRGLAISRTGGMLYCLNRAENSVQAFNIAGAGQPSAAAHRFALPDPTFDRVKLGRKIFLNPTHSGAGTTGCFSCHQDLRKDGLTWDLSKYFDPPASFSFANPPSAFRDRKGPMATQDLRSLADLPGYHWRGEQKDLEAFNDAFKDLLGGTKLGDDQFAAMKEYVFSSAYPPNPMQQLSRVFTPAATQGFINYTTLNSDGVSCLECHSLPTGSDASITDPFLTTPQSPLVVKTTQFRGMWTKLSDLANYDNLNPPAFGLASITVGPMTGHGFFHAGLVDSFNEFVNIFFPGFTQQQRDDVIRFLDEFDSGLAPATMYSWLLNQSSAADMLSGSYLANQANAKNCDFVAIGRVMINATWHEVGFLWDRSLGLFRCDTTALGTFSWQQLQTLAGAGKAELLLMGVPVWSGERIALDRDRDGVPNGDEIAAGLDPLNPDTDGDGLWDGYDPEPLLDPNTILPVGAPQVSNVQIVFATTNSIKITYETDVLSPTRVEYGLDTGYGSFAGDAFPLPILRNNGSNHWKRKHTAFLRPLRDGQTYHFRILAQAQNGQSSATADMSTGGMVPSDINTPNARVEAIDFVAAGSGPVSYTATVTVADNLGNLLDGATVNGRFTFYRNGLLDSQLIVQGTTVGGLVSFDAAHASQTSGDRAIFDVPLTLQAGGTPLPGVKVANMFFAWPEGVAAAEVLVQ